ncbi:hypothetical protein B296_00037542 [Ensete ventricosum]|uniref:Uncharacterized protein n=1 Tax=Ensete ventricosum TaxID=4639 RepID=A0A426ZZB2_ENSVE|nr:hypothetical protein B296_00037542 [Ensete ventricosum]
MSLLSFLRKQSSSQHSVPCIDNFVLISMKTYLYVRTLAKSGLSIQVESC